VPLVYAAPIRSKVACEGKIVFYDVLPVAIAGLRKAICITAGKQTQYKKLQPKDYLIQLL
jgi:hypothetical protein